MNKTRFQLPVRGKSAPGADHWATADTEASPSWAEAELAPPSNQNTGMFGSMKVPFLFDMAALLAAHRRNVTALNAANRVMFDGVRSVVWRNIEMMQQTMNGMSDSMRAIADQDCPGERAMQQTETAIKACEDAAANVKELRVILQNASAEAVEVLNKRFAEAADEVKSITRYTVRDFWDSGQKPAPFWQNT
jgi:phasin family protein